MPGSATQYTMPQKVEKEGEGISVADPDPNPDPDPRVFGPPGSGSGSFYHHAKIVRKTLISTVLRLFLNFYL